MSGGDRLARAPRPLLGRAVQRDLQRGGKLVEYLALGLGAETYAVRVADVTEILKPPPITPVPRAPKLVLGIVSVRGRLVTVVDLAKRFGQPEASLGPRARVLLADVDGEILGAVVDEVHHVHRLGEDEIEPPAVLGGDAQAHVLGIGRPKGGAPGDVLVLLDLKETLRIR